MCNTEYADKAILRRQLLLMRNALVDKPALSAAVCERAARIVKGNVMVYVSIGSEVDTFGLISALLRRDDVNVFVPYTKNLTITPVKLISCPNKVDRFGNVPAEFLENRKNSPKLDYSITPLVGFNDSGMRIGYGKGCYDRFFAAHDVYKVGLAFSCQRINFSPCATDVPLDCCVSEKDVIYF